MTYLVKVDTELCEGCGDCVDTCPSELLALVEKDGKKYAIYSGDPEDCIGCYSCESSCPNGSIVISEI
jgi:NAD-dependent dihydropyrimidine dehydrogenase PreA subunit